MGRRQTEMHVLESHWGLQSCSVCGGTIMLGEPAIRVNVGARRQVLCQACAAEPAAELYPKCRLDDLSEAA